MIFTRTLLLTACLALVPGLAGAQSLEISAPHELHASASGRAVRDLIEGRKAIAVISVPQGQALETAKRQAIAEGKRLAVPADLQFHPIDSKASPEMRLAVATLGAPSEDAQRMIHFLRSREARATVAGR